MKALSGSDFDYSSLYEEANFYYILGGYCSSLFTNQQMQWHSKELSEAVVFYRKALYILEKYTTKKLGKELVKKSFLLKNCILTDLAVVLRNQGRYICSIFLLDEAIECEENPVTIDMKALNCVFIGSNLKNMYHKTLYFNMAKELIKQSTARKEQVAKSEHILFDEYKELVFFQNWYRNTISSEDVKYCIKHCNEVNMYEEGFTLKKHRKYLKWCCDNKLFLNILNDIYSSELAYGDILVLPDFQKVHSETLLPEHFLSYHTNFDELKDDYCYARYLIYEASRMTNTESKSLKTYAHTDDGFSEINTMKVGHYKSAFRILYSIFDKITYFIHRFYELNGISKDSEISSEKVFADLSEKEWTPNKKLKDNENPFFIALLHTTRDAKSIKGLMLINNWVDPDDKTINKVRNRMEHRSLRIVQDSDYKKSKIMQAHTELKINNIKETIKKYNAIIKSIKNKHRIAKNKKDYILVESLRKEKESVKILLKEEEFLLDNHRRLSTHTLLVSITEFESRLMTLIHLARSSIIYLTLSILVEEEKKDLNEDNYTEITVPRYK